MKYQKSFFSVCFFVASIFLCSCSKKNPAERFMLSQWRYAESLSQTAQPDDTSFKPLPLSAMNNLATLLPNKQGYITLKTTFTLPSTLSSDGIAVYAGKISIAAHIYINGICIGTCGRFPPNEFGDGTGAVWYTIPTTTLKKDQNELTMTLWVEGSGGISAVPFIGTTNDVACYAKSKSFIMSEMNLLFTATLSFIAFFYLIIFFRWIQEKEYFWYAITNIGTAFYLFPFFQSEVPWLTVSWEWLAFNKFFFGICAFVTAYFATSFIRAFLKKKDSITITVLRLCLLITPIVWVLSLPTYLSFWNTLTILYICIALQMIFAVTAVIEALIKRQTEIAILLFGFSPVLISVTVDFIIQGILKDGTMPLLTIYGWQITNMFFLVILVDRFNKIRKRAEYLNVKLETEVEERTRDLSNANKKLEEDQHRAEQDMDLAVHVQQSFYPSQTQFSGWDIAVCFKPLSGISGDLYDLYKTDGKLRGFSLFDVSGHGIAAGLVTMLTKSIIYRTFNANLDKSISETLVNINNSIITAKGNIENYLTGVLFRYDEKTHELQLVNVGSPQPLYHKHGSPETQVLAPNKNEKQCGMIGISGLQVSFPAITLHIEEGDCLICYTDGLSEAVNKQNEQFGQKRIINSFARAENTTAAENLKHILADLYAFIDDTPLQDDVTIIIVKKTKEPEVEELESL